MTIQSSVKTQGTTVTQLMWFHSCYIHTLLSFIPSNLTFSYLFPLPTPFSSFLHFFLFFFLPSSPLSPSHRSLFSSYLNLTLHLPSTSSLFFLPIFSLPSLFSHHSILPSYSSPPSLLLLPSFHPFLLLSFLSPFLLSFCFPPYPLTRPLLSPLLFLSFLFHFPLPTPFFLALFFDSMLFPCFHPSFLPFLLPPPFILPAIFPWPPHLFLPISIFFPVFLVPLHLPSFSFLQ